MYWCLCSAARKFISYGVVMSGVVSSREGPGLREALLKSNGSFGGRSNMPTARRFYSSLVPPKITRAPPSITSYLAYLGAHKVLICINVDRYM